MIWNADKTGLMRVSGTLVLAAVGGAGFAWLGTPLAWMLGAMFVTTAASLSGAPTEMSQPLRRVMIAILGIMLGSAFTPQLIDDAQRWLPSVAILVVFVAMVTGAAYIYFRRVIGFDSTTAYFSSAPGGLSEMALVGESYGGNVAAISLVHTTRILIVVGTIPVYFRYFAGLDVPSMPMAPGAGTLGLGDIALLSACGLIGVPLANLIKVPAGALVGPMLLSAALHTSGLSTAGPPVWLIATAQIVIGAGIGCRFSGLSLRRVGTIILAGAGSGVLMVVAAGLTSIALAPISGQSAEALVLALAPGGLAEMSLIALVIGSQTAFISLMHILRIVLVVLIIPNLFRLFTDAPLLASAVEPIDQAEAVRDPAGD